MKRLIFLFIIFLVYGVEGRGEDIGFILATMKEERYKKDRDFFIEKAKEMGYSVFFESSDGSEQVQIEKVKEAIGRGIRVLVIQPVTSEKSFPVVEIAHKRGIPVIAYDRFIKDAELDFYVTHDNFSVGVLQAKEAVKATGGKGNYVILMGEEGHSVAHQITSGNLFILGGYPDIKIIEKKSHKNWSGEEAKKTMREVIEKWGNNLHAVLANNSSMILGAIEVLKQFGLEKKVFTAGADADLLNCRLIIKGEQSMDVLKDIKPLAEKAVEVAASFLRGEEVKYDTKIFNGKIEVKTSLIPVKVVNKNNLEEVIIKSGFHSREAIFGK